MKNTMIGFVLGLLISLSMNLIAGVTDHGDNEVSCDNGCVVSNGPFGLVRICDRGTDACIYKFGRVFIRQK